NDQKHDETDQRHDKNIIDFNKRLQTLTETDEIHDNIMQMRAHAMQCKFRINIMQNLGICNF
ncbi:MAG: hypothetical protein Q8853_02975, partial [Candidatus Phytoplasma australasiaticum]|nr:hypothetical protein [Candidatus Phytoplasma australasiaticum]